MKHCACDTLKWFVHTVDMTFRVLSDLYIKDWSSPTAWKPFNGLAPDDLVDWLLFKRYVEKQ